MCGELPLTLKRELIDSIIDNNMDLKTCINKVNMMRINHGLSTAYILNIFVEYIDGQGVEDDLIVSRLYDNLARISLFQAISYNEAIFVSNLVSTIRSCLRAQ
jgi:hypothetical protein